MKYGQAELACVGLVEYEDGHQSQY